MQKNNGVRVLRWIKSQGVIFYAGKEERKTAKNYLREMPAIFPELFSMLNAIYLYRMSEQTDKIHDGEMWRDVTTDGMGTLYAIGLSLEAISAGRKYLQSIFIHELAHVITPEEDDEHGPLFLKNQNKLLERYNEITGSNLTNDGDAPGSPRTAPEREL